MKPHRKEFPNDSAEGMDAAAVAIPSVAYSLGAQDARERRPALYIQVLAFDARTASYERRNAGKFEPAGATRIARDYVAGYRSAK